MLQHSLCYRSKQNEASKQAGKQTNHVLGMEVRTCKQASKACACHVSKSFGLLEMIVFGMHVRTCTRGGRAGGGRG